MRIVKCLTFSRINRGNHTMQITVETECTRQIWAYWKRNSVKPKLTWIELHMLILHTSSECHDSNFDFRSIDLYSLVDPCLNYYENLNALDIQLQQLGNVSFKPENGTEKLREKYLALTRRYKKLKKRFDKLKRRNARLKVRLKKKCKK